MYEISYYSLLNNYHRSCTWTSHNICPCDARLLDLIELNNIAHQTSISCCICGLLRIICLIRSGFDIMLCKEIKNLRHSNNQIDSLHTLRHTVCRVLMESQPAKKVMFISVIWSLLVYYHSSVNRRENTSTQEVDRWSTGYSFT